MPIALSHHHKISIGTLYLTLALIICAPNGAIRPTHAAHPPRAHITFQDPNYPKLFRAIYSFRFHEADSLMALVSPLKAREYSLAQMHYLWWKGLTYPAPNLYHDSLERLSNRIIGMNSPIPGEFEHDYLLQAVAGAFGVRLARMRNDRLMALRMLRRMNPALRTILRNPYRGKEHMLLAGVYHYTAAGLHRNFILLRPLFLLVPPWDGAKGRALLEESARSPLIPLATEAHYFLFKIESEVNGNWRAASRYIQWLVDAYPHNIDYALYHLAAQRELGHDHQALRDSLRTRIQSSDLNGSQQQHLLERLEAI